MLDLKTSIYGHTVPYIHLGRYLGRPEFFRVPMLATHKLQVPDLT